MFYHEKANNQPYTIQTGMKNKLKSNQFVWLKLDVGEKCAQTIVIVNK